MITLPETRPERKPLAAGSSADFRTHSGAVLNLIGPRPADVRIEDIAISLSRICRMNGHLDRHYSVAEHSVRVADRLKPYGDRLALLGLLHDGAEAYMGDCPTPLKHLLGKTWRQLEERITWAIHEYAGLGIIGGRERQAIAEADSLERQSEAEAPYDDPLDAESARIEFLREYRSLQSRLRVKGGV